MRVVKGLFTFLVLSLGMAAFLPAHPYTIDINHSKVMFKIKHLGISTVSGRFETFSGSFDFDPKNIQASKVSVTIKAESINTDVAQRDKHLRSPDFFDVEKYPTITFISKEITDVKKDTFKIHGDLTLHGVTQPLVLDVEIGGSVKDPMGNERAAFTASATLNRKDFGLTWNKVLDAGGLLVGNEVRISIEVEGVQEKPKGPKEITTASGLKYIDLAEGTGETPQSGQKVVVDYTGWLTNGKKFDSSIDRNQPFEFTLGVGQVIKGWDEGISTMKVGGKRKLIIPSELGYGGAGAGGVIPPNATLIFEVTLLKIEK